MDAALELSRALGSVCGEIAATASQMLGVLEAERSALASGDSQALDSASAAKQAHLQRLETLEAERRHLIAGIGSDARQPPFAMERALTKDAQALAQWRSALDVLARCHDLNQANGAIVELRLRQLRQAIDLLTGAPPAAGLYGPQGERASLRRSHELARA